MTSGRKRQSFDTVREKDHVWYVEEAVQILYNMPSRNNEHTRGVVRS